MRRTVAIAFAGFTATIIGCQPAQDQETTLSPARADSIKRSYEAVSLLGDTLYPIALPTATQAKYDSALLQAERNYQDDPDQLENIIWWGRRLSYLSRYREAIEVFTQGLKKFPSSAELYRHRGHRYITTRQFKKAIQDFNQSAALLQGQPIQMEPDGIPLPLPPDNHPTSLQFNVYYHLGLAYYLTGEYGKAAEAYQTCLTYCDTDDETVATVDWLYMTYRRLGEDEVAERTLASIREDMKVQENEGYLERLLMYKGYVDPESLLASAQKSDTITTSTKVEQDLRLATTGYGVANFLVSEGDSVLGEEILEDIVDGRYWAAFGYIAAEADLARQRGLQRSP